MAKPVEDLQALLKDIPGVKDAYIQKETGMEYPCIRIERDDSRVFHANNRLHWFKKRYKLTVIDRDPGSAIPDHVEELPYTSFDRFYRADGLNHFVFNSFF